MAITRTEHTKIRGKGLHFIFPVSHLVTAAVTQTGMPFPLQTLSHENTFHLACQWAAKSLFYVPCSHNITVLGRLLLAFDITYTVILLRLCEWMTLTLSSCVYAQKRIVFVTDTLHRDISLIWNSIRQTNRTKDT